MMSWEKAAHIAQVFEPFVVAFSVLFIWRQLKQQIKLTKVSNAQALFEIASSLNVQIIQDGELAKLYLDGHERYDSLNEVDQYRLRQSLLWRLTFHNLVYYQHKSGLVDEGTYRAWEDDFEAFVDRRDLKKLWDKHLKPFYSKDYRKYVDEVIEKVDSRRARDSVTRRRT